MGLLALAASVIGVGCGPSSKKSSLPQAAVETEAGQKLPVTRKIPANATYVLIAARLDSATDLLADLLKPLGKLERGLSPQAFDREVSRALGLNPLDAADLVENGFAVDREVALFSTGVFPTLAVPVADRARVAKLLEAATANSTVVVAEHRGVQATTIREYDEQVSFALVDDWLLIHFSDRRVEVRVMSWLEEILDAPKFLATEPDLQWAWDQAPPAEGQASRHDVVGLVRVPAVWNAGRAADEVLGIPRKGPGCEELHARALAAFGRGAVWATLGDGKVDGGLKLELTGDSAQVLESHLAPDPDARYQKLRTDAAGVLSLGVDLDWLGQHFRAFDREDCGTMMLLVGDADLDDVADPFAQMSGQRVFTSYHLAMVAGSLGAGAVDVEAVGWLGVADDRAADRIFADTFPGSVPIDVAGHPGRQFPLHDYRIVEPLRWSLSGGVMRLAVGRGMLEALYGGDASVQGAPRREIASFALRPDKIPDIATVFTLFLSAGTDEYLAEAISLALTEFHWMSAEATLEGGFLRVAGGFELR